MQNVGFLTDSITMFYYDIQKVSAPQDFGFKLSFARLLFVYVKSVSPLEVIINSSNYF